MAMHNIKMFVFAVIASFFLITPFFSSQSYAREKQVLTISSGADDTQETPGQKGLKRRKLPLKIKTHTVDIDASPKIITLGESSLLTWTSEYAPSASIDQDIGSVDAIGSLEVFPTQTTTYTITTICETPTGTVTDSVIRVRRNAAADPCDGITATDSVTIQVINNAVTPTPVPTSATPTPTPNPTQVALPTPTHVPSHTPIVTPTPTPDDLPPDPATVATELDLTVATSMGSATAFLYTGDNPIQTGVGTDTIQAYRCAVLRGKVLNRENQPLSGVTITILDYSEFGQTLSRADGMFDMAVNGGGYLTVDYKKDGYLPVQRQVDAPWEDYAWLPDVVMIPTDTMVTTIDLSVSTEM